MFIKKSEYQRLVNKIYEFEHPKEPTPEREFIIKLKNDETIKIKAAFYQCGDNFFKLTNNKDQTVFLTLEGIKGFEVID